MPRVILTERQRRQEMIGNNLRLLQGRRTALDMAHMIGAKSATTWRARLREPDSITADELYRLGTGTGIPAADIITKPLMGG